MHGFLIALLFTRSSS